MLHRLSLWGVPIVILIVNFCIEISNESLTGTTTVLMKEKKDKFAPLSRLTRDFHLKDRVVNSENKFHVSVYEH